MTKRESAIIGAAVRYRKGMSFIDACNDAADSYDLPEDMSIKAWKMFKTSVKNYLIEMNDWKGE